MLSLLLFTPILFGILALLLHSRLLNRVALFGTAMVYILGTAAWYGGRHVTGLPAALEVYLAIDAAALFFLVVMTLVYTASAVYTIFYFKEHNLTVQREASYVSSLMFFLSAMTGVLTATHVALMWVFVEATTLTSALLIYFEQRKASLEAAWKYIYICSVGIALAFVGIIVLSIGSKNFGSLFFMDLYRHAGEINTFWLKLAFSFILVGFGTKIGVAPIHAWLPDAHSEAPSPVSALLSGSLLNTAFLALLRIHKLMVAARLESFADLLLLLTGFMSLFVSAVFMLRIRNYKRMLAYSSIENMGLLFLGTALGGVGMFAVFLHSIAHSLSKASLFLTSGNILYLFKSKKIDRVTGLIGQSPLTGRLWLISFFAIAGMPPFPVFLSKFILIQAFVQAGRSLLIIPFMLLIIVIYVGMGGTVLKMTFGKPPATAGTQAKLPTVAQAPQMVLLAILLIIGVYLPSELLHFINDAVHLFQ
mgnify:CR=1 FL=1